MKQSLINASSRAMHDLPTRLAVIWIFAGAVITLALLSEYWGGLLPCALCLKQRWTFYLAVPLLTVAYFYAPYAHAATLGLLRTIGIIFLAGAALGFYHAGIEYGFWAGPPTCGGGGAQAQDTQALFQALEQGKMVRCDAPAFTLFGISLAGYNMIACLVLAALAFYPFETKAPLMGDK